MVKAKAKATFVTALLTGINNFRSVTKYVEYGRKFLSLSVNKVIFIEETIYKEYFSSYNNDSNKIIFIRKEDLYLYHHLEKINNFHLMDRNKEKDTVDYMFVQCNKTEWIREAIKINHFNSNQFIWLDFGVYHLIDDDEIFATEIERMSNCNYDRVRISSHGDLRDMSLTSPCWFFLGTVFGGEKEKLVEFSDRMRTKCIDVIDKMGLISWEINIWYLIYLEDPTIFDRYFADHDPSILTCY